MGILPLAWISAVDDPLAKDPFDDDAAVRAMYDEGGILTHGRLPENIDKQGAQEPRAARPARPEEHGARSRAGIEISGFLYAPGGYSANRGFPTGLMRPPTIKPGPTVTFTNDDALLGEPQTEQAWHSITSCKAPCNRGSGIGYPLARGPIKFDSGQLGYGDRAASTGRDDRHRTTTRRRRSTKPGRPTRTSAGSTRSCGARSGSRARRSNRPTEPRTVYHRPPHGGHSEERLG